MKSHIRWATFAAATAILTAATGCSVGDNGSSGGGETVVVGYQSKTINTVTAGTLLRSQGYFEQRLKELGARTGKKYSVQWQDYDTGAPITAQMVAGKIDIGSMGDYPLLINGSRTQANPNAKTELVSITGYNPKGALNSVVVKPDSPITSLPELAGKKVSASVGSAGHGTLVQALSHAGINPNTGVEVLNQQPQVGSSALDSGQVSALAQFVAWPGLLVFQNKAKLLYDGASLNTPTFHGVVARRAWAGDHADVLNAFLRAQLDATQFIHDHTLQASQIVADATGLPAEVVYLYNGPGGTSFDTTLKPSLITALAGDVPYWKSIGDFADLDVPGFVNDQPLRKAFADQGANYDADLANAANPTPGTAGELWLAGETQTHPYASAKELIAAVHTAKAQGKTVRAAYITDTALGTRWYADKALWVRDGDNLLPFITQTGADQYRNTHPSVTVSTFDAAVNS